MNVEAALAPLGRVESREPYGYASSWPLEDIRLRRPDGSRLQLLLKRFDGGDTAGKPAFVCDPAREIDAYALLGRVRALGTPRCYAAGSRWLALEKVAGAELWQHGELAAWEAAARWAAGLHRRFASLDPAPRRLLRHDARLHRRWLARAHAAHGDAVAPLLAAGELAVAQLALLPRTLIHGELYPSNVLVRGARVAAVDWEMAGIGPGVIDLAALLTGWKGRARRAILAAAGGAEPRDLAAARLVLAMQWLGWSAAWEPPAAQRHDWLAEASDAAGSIA